MKELWKVIYDTLVADDVLVDDLLGAANIGQARQPKARALPCVVYSQWSNVYEPVDQASGNRDPQQITVLFSCVAQDEGGLSYAGSTLLYEIAERLKALLHGADLGWAGLHCYSALYDDFETDADYDEDSHEWRLDLRFRFVVRAK